MNGIAPAAVGTGDQLPLLPDPKDDTVLEVAIASGATHIVTFNRKDFRLASQFGIAVVPLAEFIRHLP